MGPDPARPGDVLLVAAAGAVALSAIAAAVESVVLNRRLRLGPRLVLAVAVGAFPLSFPRRQGHGMEPDQQPIPGPDLASIQVHDEDSFDQTPRRYRVVDGIIIPFTRSAGGKWVPGREHPPATSARSW